MGFSLSSLYTGAKNLVNKAVEKVKSVVSPTKSVSTTPSPSVSSGGSGTIDLTKKKSSSSNKSKVKKAIDLITSTSPIAVLTNPLKAVRETINTITNAELPPTKAETTLETTEQAVLGAAAGVGLGGGIGGAIAGATSVPLLSALISKSEKVSAFVETTATNLITGTYASATGEKIAGVIEGDVGVGDVSEPEWYATARALGLGAGISLLAAGGVYLGYKYYKGRLEKATAETPSGIPSEPVIVPQSSALSPVMQETTTISTGKKRYRRPKTKEKPSVKQSVRILINNASKSTGISSRKIYKHALLN